MMARFPQALRWSLYFSLALGLHGATAAALLARWNESADLAPNAPMIMIDLAPIAVAPSIVPNDMPPDRVESKLVEPEPESEPEKPIEKIELRPDPAPKPELTATPPPKPIEKKVEKKQPKRMASVARMPSAAETKADHAAAPMPGPSARDSNAQANWNAQLYAQIARHKYFSGSERGTVRVAFSIDRSGGVHNARVLASSGSSVLDREALALIQRSQPLPPPPPEVPGAQIPKVLPVQYNIR
jgi:periplasmic protein TonB